MRTVFLLGLTGCFVVAILLLLWFRSRLVAFLRDVPEIRSTPDLERFKAVVAGQMYGALVQIVVLILPWVVFGLGMVSKVLRAADALWITLWSVVILLLGLWMKGTEKRAQAVPVADEILRLKRDRVVETWLKKALPDW